MLKKKKIMLESKQIYIFGTGENGINLMEYLKENDIKLMGFVDNNIDKVGTFIEKYEVFRVSELKQDKSFNFIIISNKNKDNCIDISNQLIDLGYKENEQFVIWEDVIKENVCELKLNEKTLGYLATKNQSVDNAKFTHPLGFKRFCNLYNELEYFYKKTVFPNLDLTKDEKKLELIFNLIGTNDGESIYLLNYLKEALAAEGDICEFGIAQGATSALFAYEMKDYNKYLWLFDSFEGLSIPTIEDELKDDIFNFGDMSKYAYSMKCSINEVKNRLESIQLLNDKVNIVPGFIDKTITNPNLPKQVCFAYIDFDLYEPILIALNYLHEVVSNQGVIVIDDYDFFSTGAKLAVDRFYETHKDENKYEMILPIDGAGHFCILKRINS